MKKSTKRLVSMILATSMLLTSVYASPVVAADSTSNDVISTYAATVTLDFTTLAAAAEDKTPVEPAEVSAPFGIEGTVIKRTNGDGSVKSVDVAKSNGGAITVTVEGPATITAVASSTGTTNTSAIAITKADGTVVKDGTVSGAADGKSEFSCTVEEAGTYRIITPENNDYKRDVRIYSVSVTTEEGATDPTEGSTEAPEPDTEAPTEESTEAPTEESTEAPAEPTTAAPTEGKGLEGNILDDFAVGEFIKTAADGQIVMSDEAGFEVKANDTADKEVMNYADGSVTSGTGRFYATKIQGTENPKNGSDSYNAKGKLVVPTTGSYVTVKPKEESTLTLDFKVGLKKQYAVVSVDDATGDKEEVDFIDNPQVDRDSADIIITRSYDVVPGKTYYITSAGTKITFFAIVLTPKSVSSDSTTTTTTEEPSSEATTAEPSSEATTAEPVEGALNVSVKADGVEASGNSYTVSESAGKVTVSVDVAGALYNNYTFDLTYDPAVVVPTAVAEAESPFDGYSTYKTSDGTVYPAYDVNAINAAIAKTGSTGTVRIANFFGSEADKALLSAGDGTLVKIDFSIVGTGDAKIKVVPVEKGFWADPGQEEPLEVAIADSKIEITDEVVVPAGTIGVIADPTGEFEKEAGESLVINFKTVGAAEAPFNNYSFEISYDPAVLKFAGTEEAADSIIKAGAEGQMFNVDGNTEGKIRVSGFVGTVAGTTDPMLVTADGTLVSVKFEVVAAGDAGINVASVDAGFYGANYDPVDVMYSIGAVIIKSQIVEPDIPEVIGDVDMSAFAEGATPEHKAQPWTTNDAAMLHQWCIDNTRTPECEKAYPDSWLYIVDVNGDNRVTTADAARIHEKVIDDTQKFEILAQIEAGTYDYELTYSNMFGSPAQQ